MQLKKKTVRNVEYLLFSVKLFCVVAWWDQVY